MKTYDAKRVINGTYGEVWLDSEYMAEVTGLEAKISFDKADVNQVKQLMKGSKVTGASGSGTLKLNHVRSYMTNLMLNCLKKGQFPSYTIISNLKDPDAFGAEKVRIKGVTFDEVSVADWEAASVGEESLPFTFTSAEFINKINK